MRKTSVSISDWLDGKVAEGIDVSHIVLPDDLAYKEVPEVTIYSRRLIPVVCSVPGTIPLQL